MVKIIKYITKKDSPRYLISGCQNYNLITKIHVSQHYPATTNMLCVFKYSTHAHIHSYKLELGQKRFIKQTANEIKIKARKRKGTEAYFIIICPNPF
jgi:hypothetical protein